MTATDPYLLASTILHDLERRGIKLTRSEEKMWEQAEILYQAEKARKAGKK